MFYGEFSFVMLSIPSSEWIIADMLIALGPAVFKEYMGELLTIALFMIAAYSLLRIRQLSDG